MSRLDAVQYISHGIAKVQKNEQVNVEEEFEENVGEKKSKPKSSLEVFCVVSAFAKTGVEMEAIMLSLIHI